MGKMKFRLAALGLLAACALWGSDPATTKRIMILCNMTDLHPGSTMNIHCTCSCPGGCGNNGPDQDIYLRRLANDWTMGLWYPLAKLTVCNHGQRTSYTARVPDNVQPADDYVITVWSGDENCWGQSNRFAISRAGEPAPTGAEILITPRGGETLYRGNWAPIRWYNANGWAPCQVDLLKGGEFVQRLRASSYDGLNWLVGTGDVRNYAVNPPVPEIVQFSDLADGVDYQIRLQRVDGRRMPVGTPVTGERFAIATPTLQVTQPMADTTFRCGRDLVIAWNALHFPAWARIKIEARLFALDGSALPAGCRPGGGALLVADNAKGNSMLWRLPLPGAGGMPGTACFPLRGEIRVSWMRCSRDGISNYEVLTATSGRFTVTAR